MISGLVAPITPRGSPWRLGRPPGKLTDLREKELQDRDLFALWLARIKSTVGTHPLNGVDHVVNFVFGLEIHAGSSEKLQNHTAHRRCGLGRQKENLVRDFLWFDGFFLYQSQRRRSNGEMPKFHKNFPCLAGMGPAYKVFFTPASALY
jgi:hypothetical protein